jgi:hypothetical protein
VTTLADLSDVRIISVRRKRLLGRRVVEVITESSGA